MKNIIINVLEKLENSNYFDPAEYLYDAIKGIRHHLNDDDIELYLHDFLWGLNSPTISDFDGVVKESIDIIKNMQSFINKNKELPSNTREVEILINGSICKCMYYDEKSVIFPNGFFGTYYKMVIDNVIYWRNCV
jgi:hypothetical protein